MSSSLFTPRHTPRHLPYTPRPSTRRTTLASPFTPAASRRTSTLLARTVPASQADGDAAPDPLDEAARYLDGDLKAVLRGSAIDVLVAARKLAHHDPVHSSLAYVTQLCNGLQTQLRVCDALMSAPGQRPATRAALGVEYQRLSMERHTWVLLQTLWRDREIRGGDLFTKRLEPSVLEMEDLAKVEGFVKLQRIVEWLENVANDSLDRSPHDLQPLDDPAYTCAYTAARNPMQMPVSIDYAASGGSLHEIERKADTRVSREVYRFIRAGRLNDAEDVCRSVSQPWRAALISGGKRAFQLAADGTRGKARLNWKRAAIAIATSSNRALTAHERAVFGVLAGVLEPVLAVAESYEDEAWARMCVKLEETAEKIIASGADNVAVTDDEIVQSLEECKDHGNANDAFPEDILQSMRTVQAYVSLGPTIESEHLASLLKALSQLSKHGVKHNLEWASRFAAQLCIFLKFSGLMSSGDRYLGMYDSFDTAVQSYVSLVVANDVKMEETATKRGTMLPTRPLVSATAAHFLAEISAAQRIVDTYVRLLKAALQEDLKSERVERENSGVASRKIEERRTLCLKKAGQCFSKETLRSMVVGAVNSVWEDCLSGNVVEQNGGLDNVVTGHSRSPLSEEDERVMRAIEFLLFPEYPEYSEALMRVTKVARYFFIIGKRNVAERIIRWFPKQILGKVDVQELRSALHEFSCWEAYLDAVKSYGEWKSFCSSKRPAPLDESVREAAEVDPATISYDDQAQAKLRVDEHNLKMQEYTDSCITYREIAVDNLKRAILCKGGWMEDINSPDGTDNEGGVRDAMQDVGDANWLRPRELKAVREYGIPQLCMLLHDVYDESEMLNDAVQLAVTIAEEDRGLYRCFGKEEMRAFLARIADSCVSLADEQVRVDALKRPYAGTFFEEL